ncbi:CaiB/BaiF CoA transferase family protein [Natronorubrum sp. FCH18a]|uniref:CaiB/BaiF CoA transferase family protein n=1 Tax=Natronorubrum sp. FCH18a TaxID=3447018 RepID=UPI003F518291
MSLPFDGVRVLELNQSGVAGNASQLLGDMGAEVVKIEPPDGDNIRDYPAQFSLPDGNSHVFANVNRNKKSVPIDLKTTEGRELFLELVAGADVVIEGFRPGVVDRLGVGYETAREHNESIVYCSLTGYGQDGPYEQWVGHDINYIAVSGLLGMTGEKDGKPALPGIPVADFAGSMMAAFQISAELRGAERTGEGEYIDVSMTDVVAFLFGWIYLPFTHHPDSDGMKRGETFQTGTYPCYDVYETKDGRYISVGAYEPYFWEALCLELELPEYADPEYRFAEDAVRDALAERFAERTLTDWMDTLDPTEIPVAPVHTPKEVWTDKQIQHRALEQTVEKGDHEFTLINSPASTASEKDRIRSPHPELGEHVREVVAEIGLSQSEIDKLIEAGVLNTADTNR